MVVVTLAVHPGHANRIGYVSEEYGYYPSYQSRLRDFINSHNSMIWLSSIVGERLPFNLSKSIEKSSNLGYLTSRLRKGTIVNVCGELLWYYEEASLIERLRKYSERLPEVKRSEFNLLLNQEYNLVGSRKQKFDIVGFAKKLDLDPMEIILKINSYKMRTVKIGCVEQACSELRNSRKFRVKKIRELCYPTNKP